MNVKKGDTVLVLTGKDKGKKGKVLISFPSKDKVLIEGINLKKKAQKPRKSGEKGQIVEVATPIHISNVKKA
ncbi:MAG: 50S ribosomal protein L24 [Candidatus Pacebacteria bacterium]|nr:50S ribosomal protein L24 [Candidatus Paceibacterota bacterium]MBP9058462.1 50S ribosomal protein L24 [Candidatus Paceibacterota bacterium]MBP9769938.1 50S ribosomal protein L24 [Candidatus Paceibacterota bacterium]